MTEIIYTPGVCNIGKEEVAKRKMVGWIGLVSLIVVSGLLVLLHLPRIWRIIALLPAFATAAGFVQAYFHFCVAYGSAAVYNVGPLGATQPVTDQSVQKRDQEKTRRLYRYITLLAIVLTVCVYFLPR